MILIILMTVLGVFHDFHVSRTEIRYNPTDGIFETTCHIFIDDLELALVGQDGNKLHLGTKKEASQSDSLIMAYLEKNLILKSSHAPLEWKWLGKEVSDDLSAFWIYIYAESGAPREVSAINTILLETYDDQKNIVEFRYNDVRVSTLTQRGDSHISLFEKEE